MSWFKSTRKEQRNSKHALRPVDLPPTEEWPGGGIMAADGTVYMRKTFTRYKDGKPYSILGPLIKIGRA